MNDTRTAGYQFNWFYDAKFYKNFLSTYFTSSSELGSQTYLGFNAIAFPAICLLFFKRKPEEKPMRILFILSTLLLLFPAFGWLLNGLSYATNRWIWAYSLLVAYIVTTQWKKLRHITVGQAVACVGALALYSLLAIPLMTTDTRNIGVSVLLAFLIIVLCASSRKSTWQPLWCWYWCSPPLPATPPIFTAVTAAITLLSLSPMTRRARS